MALLVSPIGRLASWTYHKQGYIDLQAMALICIGFFFGWIGAKIATGLLNIVLERIFGKGILTHCFKEDFLLNEKGQCLFD